MGSKNGAAGGGAGGGGASGGALLIGGGVALAFASVAALVWALQPTQDTAEPAGTAPPAPLVSAPQPADQASAAQPDAAQAPAAPAAPAVAAAPLGFDTVRVTPEGEALVAGRAGAEATVLLKVDGAEAARAIADSQGNFVAMFTLPPSDQPRLLSLVEAGPPERTAEQTVTLAPVVGPKPAEVLAEAAPAPQSAAPAEPAAPQALLVTDQGAQVLQAPELAAGGQVSVDAISYTPDGAVQLSGRAASGAALRLYLDNAPVAELLAAGTGQWVATLRDVPPGLYTLRADQIGADGKVTSRFETPFQRETPEALAAALKPQAIPGQPRPVAPAAQPAPVAVARASSPVQPAEPVTSAPETAPVETPVVEARAEEPQAPISITVQPGFTLWRIARENFGDGVMYVKVFEANKAQIRDPDLIYPGQVFTIPKG